MSLSRNPVLKILSRPFPAKSHLQASVDIAVVLTSNAQQPSSIPKMTIKFLLMVNKQGQTRLAKYFDEFLSVDERRVLEGEIVRKCLARTDKQVTLLCTSPSANLPVQCSFIEHRKYTIVYRRYASLFFLVGIDAEEVRPFSFYLES